VIASSTVSVWADEIKLHNGDRLTGEIAKMEDNILALHTDYGGEMKLIGRKWSV
jgi:hypothetical protein